MSEFRDIKLTDLVASSTNPRTEFEENSLNELAESIKSHGVLQPIIVREQPDLDNKFKIVCGERRFRASKIAKLKTIPASVRELTDDEVFELQIIENLERKDVHPLDEAKAFKRMLESGKYTMEDIAAKVAKNTTFVAQRLKLNDLIPELQQDFLKGEFGIGHAILLARVSEDEQKDIFDDSKNQWSGGYSTVQKLKNRLDNRGKDLDEAIFDIEDPNIFVPAGACTDCPKCSFANPILFPEYEEKLCFDKQCFETKTDIVKRHTLENIVKENPAVVLYINYCYSDYNKLLVKYAEQTIMKKVYQDYQGYRVVQEETKGAVPAFDLQNFEHKFVLLDYSKNKTNAEPDENFALKEELSNLKSRSARAMELDREKIYKRALAEIVKDEDKNSKMLGSEALFEDEKKALALALISYSDDDWIKEDYGVKLGYMDRHNQIDEIWSEEFFAKLIRHKIQRELITENIADFEKSDKPAYMMNIFKHYFPAEIELYTLEQNAVAEKRIKKSDERIKVLESKIKASK